MVVLIVAVSIALIMIGLSVQANSRFRQEERLPMQWSISGSVNWTAPRILALSFTPALTIGILIFFVIASISLQPRPGQEGEVVPALMCTGSIFIAVHLFHLWLIGKTLRRDGS